jgi:hypothetical protein
MTQPFAFGDLHLIDDGLHGANFYRPHSIKETRDTIDIVLGSCERLATGEPIIVLENYVLNGVDAYRVVSRLGVGWVLSTAISYRRLVSALP